MDKEKELVKSLKETVKQQKEIKEQLDNIKEKRYAIEKTLIEHLQNIGAEATAKYDGIGWAKLRRPKLRAYYLKDDAEEVFSYLRQNGYDELIKENIHHATLSTFIKSLIEEGKEIPSIFKYNIIDEVSVY